MGLRALWFGDGTHCAIGLRGGACVHAASSIARDINASRNRFDCTIAHHAAFEGAHSLHRMHASMPLEVEPLGSAGADFEV
jgi:hypothetical protein